MSTTALVSEIQPGEVQLAEARGEGKLRKGLMVGFAGTVTIALTLAGWYLTGRISTADAGQLSAAAQPATVPSAQQPVQQAARSLAPEYYLQIAALGSSEDATYLKRLSAKGFQASIETTPADQIGQILIGPYEERSALQTAQQQLAAAGILATETTR
jgi:hypothetical protein